MNELATPLYFGATLRHIENAHAQENLMLRAGAAAFEWAVELLGGAASAATGSAAAPAPTLVLAGPGNNGGDALEMARLLRRAHFPVEVVFLGEATRLPPDAAQAYQQLIAEGGQTRREIPPEPHWGLIVDGLFGIGLARPLEGDYAHLIAAAEALDQAQGCPLLALDCPSGLNADTGVSLGSTLRASHTLTFIAAKPGLYTADGPDYCGQIRIHDLRLGG
ncbi:MAG: NAD(P)H-hydrate epimerase, partial [Zoogloeaceae bacterium]|nr:NAD(P)H-hydrate epimerase [Zoogloeaceae bacterium]